MYGEGGYCTEDCAQAGQLYEGGWPDGQPAAGGYGPAAGAAGTGRSYVGGEVSKEIFDILGEMSGAGK